MEKNRESILSILNHQPKPEDLTVAGEDVEIDNSNVSDELGVERYFDAQAEYNELLSRYIDIKRQLDEKKKELEEAEREGITDALTGCYNRNYFEKFRKHIFDPERDDKKIGLIFVDLNDLNVINDTMGHEAGDELLKSAANLLKSSFRKDDTEVVRFGGDEFVIICHNYQNDEKFEETLNLIMKERVANSSISFAFGVAVYDKDIDLIGIANTLNRADDFMYRHKNEMKRVKEIE